MAFCNHCAKNGSAGRCGGYIEASNKLEVSQIVFKLAKELSLLIVWVAAGSYSLTLSKKKEEILFSLYPMLNHHMNLSMKMDQFQRIHQL